MRLGQVSIRCGLDGLDVGILHQQGNMLILTLRTFILHLEMVKQAVNIFFFKYVETFFYYLF